MDLDIELTKMLDDDYERRHRARGGSPDQSAYRDAMRWRRRFRALVLADVLIALVWWMLHAR